jgi:hypothetical protein
MDVFNHFSCYSKLPVLLEHVIQQIIDTGVVASVEIYPIDVDPAHLRGFCWVYEDRPHNSINHHLRAIIGVSKHLSREEGRVVICKELLHLLDTPVEAAQSREEVNVLVEEIVLPVEAAAALTTLSDHSSLLLAIAILMPECAIDELRPRLEAGAISIETIAKLARLPESHVRLTFSPTWSRILEMLQRKYPLPPCEPRLDLVQPRSTTADEGGSTPNRPQNR